MDSVLGRAQEGTFTVSSERLGSVPGDPQFPGRTKVREGLLVISFIYNSPTKTKRTFWYNSGRWLVMVGM